MINNILLVAAGGALGSVLRYLLACFAQQQWVTTLPWGTITANLTGSALIGLVLGLNWQGAWPDAVRLFLMVGVLGGFTTFSAYSLETLQLFRDGQHLAALLNVLVSNVAVLLLVAAGFWVGKSVGG